MSSAGEVFDLEEKKNMAAFLEISKVKTMEEGGKKTTTASGTKRQIDKELEF